MERVRVVWRASRKTEGARDRIETGRESGGGKGDASPAAWTAALSVKSSLTAFFQYSKTRRRRRFSCAWPWNAPGEAVVAGAEDAEYDGIQTERARLQNAAGSAQTSGSRWTLRRRVR